MFFILFLFFGFNGNMKTFNNKNWFKIIITISLLWLLLFWMNGKKERERKKMALILGIFKVLRFIPFTKEYPVNIVDMVTVKSYLMLWKIVLRYKCKIRQFVEDLKRLKLFYFSNEIVFFSSFLSWMTMSNPAMTYTWKIENDKIELETIKSILFFLGN